LQVLKSANVHVIGTVATFDPVHRATRRKHGRPRGNGNGAAAPAAPEAGQNTETIAPAPTDQLVRPGRSKAPGDGESN
jgi:hypothetical protein